MKKKIFFIILGIIFLPIIINYVLMLPTPFNFPIIGSNVDWLSFWGTYNYGIYNQLLLNILRIISQKYGHNL